MPCYSLRQNGKKVGHICGDFGAHCSDCGAVADNLCDFPVGDGKTCDRSICDEHSNAVGVDIHYCASHYQEWKLWIDSGGVAKELSNVQHFPQAKK